jgi:glutamine amidotransferase
MADVVIVDSGGANLASLEIALARLGATSQVSRDADTLRGARRVLLPGVGSAGDAMSRLRAAGLDRALPALTQPLLGICLGMQLLCARSEEDDAECLGIVPATVKRLAATPDRPVPHMGWNRIRPTTDDPLLAGVRAGEHAYFVHSYAVEPGAATVATTDYGTPLSAALRVRNFWGVQFHPERSARAGAAILAAFLALPCS